MAELKKDRPKILVVDDDTFSTSAVEALLADEGYELYFAKNGMDGIAMAVHIRPDIILLDVMMPQMDGYEVCKQIRGMEEVSSIPIVLITSLDDHESRVAGFNSGADDFITKPYNRIELLVRVRTILRLNRFRRIADQQEELKLLNERLIIAYDKTIEGWSQALDLRDKETEGHTTRVTELAIRFADYLGLDGEDLDHIRRGSLLHDVGKLGIPDSILHKPGSLNNDEWRIMKMHPIYAHKWLRGIDFLSPALHIPYEHHEKWDGSGYPQGLYGETIHVYARIFALVDVWDALMSDRHYRKALPESEARAYITTQAGIHFDPNLVGSFIKMLDENIAQPAAKT